MKRTDKIAMLVGYFLYQTLIAKLFSKSSNVSVGLLRKKNYGLFTVV